MQDFCDDCLSKEVCDITGASCQKMSALVIQRKQNRNGRTTMSNDKPTPKTVAEKNVAVEATETKVEKPAKTIPAQAEAQDGEQTPKAEKLTLVQRLKATAEKLKENKRSQVLLIAAVVCAGVAIKKSRGLKPVAVSVEPLDPEDITINGVGDDDEPTDSL